MTTLPSWNLDTPYAGGPTGSEAGSRYEAVSAALEQLEQRVRSLGPPARQHEDWRVVLREAYRLRDTAQELYTVASCALAAHGDNADYRACVARYRELFTKYSQSWIPIQQTLCDLDAETFERLVDHPDVADLAPALHNARRAAALNLPVDQELVATELEREALDGWANLYREWTAAQRATLDGEELGLGALGAQGGSPDADLRERAFHAGQEVWERSKMICAASLTHITGYRVWRNGRLGADVLAHTLQRNRLTEQTLEAMWSAAEHCRPALHRYAAAKARLIGKEKLDWWDQRAPLPLDSALDFDTAISTIIQAFDAFDPSMARFVEQTVEHGWIDAEPRTTKRAGAFCARLSNQRESRVLMTWKDTFSAMVILAHELGHGFHNHQLFQLPSARRTVPSSLAETASTFAETVLRNAAIEQTTDRATRLAMLDQVCQSAMLMLMNIPARFAFEKDLYRLRAEGPLRADVLSELMVDCQKQAFGDTLATFDPTYWCARHHFYIPSFGFYNWPYTFGFLFSNAVYEVARSEGRSFVPRFHDLLQRTGYEWTEPLVRDTIGGDTTDPSWWIATTAPVIESLEAFVQLADETSATA